jgi:Spy/CpxP family protein refolding chaperone
MGRWLILSLDLGNMQKASDLRANDRAPLPAVPTRQQQQQQQPSGYRWRIVYDIITNNIVDFRDSGSSFDYFCDTPRHACANIVRKLLDQLTETHDERQAASQKVWDAFLQQRSSRAKTIRAEQPRHVSSFTGASATMANGGDSIAVEVLLLSFA